MSIKPILVRQFSCALSGLGYLPELICVHYSSQEASCLRTCVYYISQDGYTDINEQFVLDGDSEENHMNLKISILETTLSAAGEEIASGIISFDKLIQGQDTEKFREARVSLVNDVDKEIGFLMINAACKSYKGSLVQKHSSNGHRGTVLCSTSSLFS